MEDNAFRSTLKSQFPNFNQSELINNIIESAKLIKVESGTTILEPDTYIKYIPLVVKGIVKVSRIDNSGRIVFLYYIKPGETCAMTLSSSLKREKSKVIAIAEENTEIIIIPADNTYNYYHKYPSWQHFVIQAYTNRFGEMINVIEGVTFYHMQDRVKKHLQLHAQVYNTSIIQLSHKQIARDLASSREVISRILKQFEKEGLVDQTRGEITLNPLFFKYSS